MAAVGADLPAPPVTSGDRLSFTFFLAAALHAAVILGVTFTWLERRPSTHTMEVTLAQHRSEEAPEKADFLAQFKQKGSGTLEEKALTTSPDEAQFHDNVIRDTAPQEVAAARESRAQLTAITTTGEADRHVPAEEDTRAPQASEQPNDADHTLLERSLAIASLEARLDIQRQLYAKRPRIKRLTSLATTSSVDAWYLHSWRRKIEKVGNINYPSEARRRRLYGNLRLMVAILPDGSLHGVELLESSGHKVLDDAAIRIVRLAAPFAPFPDELRRTTDVLEIIRTWQFRKNSSLRSF